MYGRSWVWRLGSRYEDDVSSVGDDLDVSDAVRPLTIYHDEQLAALVPMLYGTPSSSRRHRNRDGAETVLIAVEELHSPTRVRERDDVRVANHSSRCRRHSGLPLGDYVIHLC